VHYYGGPTAVITLSGADPDLNIFAVDGADLSAANTLRIVVPQGSTVLVNVSGASVQMSGFGILLEGVQSSHVLYNFCEATSLTMQGISVEGTVLAPNAAVVFNNGQLNGTLVAASFEGNGETHDVLFAGCLTGSGPLAPQIVGAKLGAQRLAVLNPAGTAVQVWTMGADGKAGTADDVLLGSAVGGSRSESLSVGLVRPLRGGDRIYAKNEAGPRSLIVYLFDTVGAVTLLGSLVLVLVGLFVVAAFRRPRRAL
jgi:hypothetical protein